MRRVNSDRDRPSVLQEESQRPDLWRIQNPAMSGFLELILASLEYLRLLVFIFLKS
jgi:hypothetical protein